MPDCSDSTISFAVLDYHRKPLEFLTIRVPHASREDLVRRIFTHGIVSLIAKVVQKQYDGENETLGRSRLTSGDAP